MTTSIYKEAQLVQIPPDGEWYVAIPHPEKPGILAVDTGKNLTFAGRTYAGNGANDRWRCGRQTGAGPESLHQPAPGIYSGHDGSLGLQPAGQCAVPGLQQRQAASRNKLILLTLLELQAALGRALYQALTAAPVREETPYIEHDFIAHGLQARLAMAGEEHQP